MFKFGFFDSDTVEDESKLQNDTEWYEAKQILPSQIHINVNETITSTVVVGDIVIKYIPPDTIINKITSTEGENNSIISAESNHSDLVKAKYEGGLKVWECTIDLIKYLEGAEINFKDKRILDLGCGAGILGIYTLLKGSCTDFQDYNEEVINYSTIPNCILNSNSVENSRILEKCNFFSGDWKSFLDVLNKDTVYDYILTSETIYNSENYDKLYGIFNNKLKKDGEIYLAAKTYYFGVGGGTRQFEKLLKEENIFSSTICWTCTEGVQREIIKIKKI